MTFEPIAAKSGIHALAVNVRQTVIPSLELVGKSFVVDARLMQQPRLQIVNTKGVLDDIVAEVIRRTV
jgi:hypothetical protein